MVVHDILLAFHVSIIQKKKSFESPFHHFLAKLHFVYNENIINWRILLGFQKVALQPLMTSLIGKIAPLGR